MSAREVTACGGCEDPDRARLPTSRECVTPCRSAGTQSCVRGCWTGCAAPEECGNGRDDDCDGRADEDCGECSPGRRRGCYGGPINTRGVGACLDGAQVCGADGRWGPCAGDVRPAVEECNAVDDDCDGPVDEGLTFACSRGGCRGTTRCESGRMTECDAPVPAPEVCNNRDDDCDRVVDEDTEVACYTGPPGTQGVGVCRGGTYRCVAGALDRVCAGEVTPSAEVCNGLDDDCNGRSDDGLRVTFTFHNRCMRSTAFVARGCNVCRESCDIMEIPPGESRSASYPRVPCYEHSAASRGPRGVACFDRDEAGRYVGEVWRYCLTACTDVDWYLRCPPGSE